MESIRPAADRIVSGDPVQQVRNLYQDTSGQFFSGIWECSPGKWRVTYTEHEFCLLIAGRIVLTDAEGRSTEFRAGDAFVIPAGFAGTWETAEPTRKLYAIFEPA
jgi:uncharacterized cupin superfamily protein